MGADFPRRTIVVDDLVGTVYVVTCLRVDYVLCIPRFRRIAQRTDGLRFLTAHLFAAPDAL